MSKGMRTIPVFPQKCSRVAPAPPRTQLRALAEENGPGTGMGDSNPRVSIGLPVYNGEAYLSQAIESILAQSYPDFELIISDNASTDRTAEICKSYSDPRIRYTRNETNLGGSKNFALVFEYSRGEYFRWAADDDVLEPDFLERCVEVLDRDPTVVSCFSRMKIIDSTSEIKKRGFSNELDRLDSPRADQRFGEFVLTRHGCFHVWGLMRRNVLAQTRLIAAYIGADRGLLAELALRGRVVELEDDLFRQRDHGGRSVKAIPFYLRAGWFDPARAGTRSLPNWRLWGDYWRSLRVVRPSLGERLRCALILVRWPFSNGNPARLTMDLVVALVPGAWRLHVKAKAWHARLRSS